MTAEQRSMVVMAVVIPKLLYIGRHQWPTTELVADFQKMIENFVWHARFSADAVAGRAWINRYVATLPRRDGGLAVPNLKLELLSHAAVTVNTWAIEADTTTLVVGDVIAGADASGPAPMLYVSPRVMQPPKTGPRLRETIWTTGVHLCNAYGGVVAVAEKADMVRALHCLQYFRGPIALTRRGRRLITDASTLSGHLWTRYTAAEVLKHGEFCVEWLPYFVLKGLRLYSEKGTTVNPVSRFWSICAVGAQNKDVLHWTWTRQHRLVVTVFCTKVTKTIQRHVGHLVQLLIPNFPQLILPGDHYGRVRYSTRGEGGAQLRCVTGERRLVGQGGAADESARPGDIHSHRELTRCMQRDVGPA
ncbi:hypothetical protein PF007_g27147 [Phytophthora fragariae]|uniref:Uncharacterized protein n=1 Tax=Phytophthora fragariae TaxID=53985 RepID=A0A6A3Q7K9_9STRA|nr:hypothetical protein PF007_g27147 [Phytophthora fragariae]